jgi:hypothetical protein
MRQRDLEPLDEEIKKLEEQKTKIEENYNAQSEALDKVIEKENELFAIKAKSLDVAGALSRGDVAGAAKAALELERELSQQRAQDQKQMLDQQRQLSIEAIDTRIKTIADEKKVIEEDILRLQKEQRGIQDSIYNAQVIINNESARLESLYKLGNSQLDILKQELILAEIEQRKLNAAVQEQIDLLERLNRAKQGQPTSQTTTAPTDYSNYVFPDPSLNLNEQQSAEILAALENLIPADFNPFAGLSGFFANGGKVFSSGMSKYLMGGRVGYKGSTERAPGMMYGGSAKKYAYGSTVPGRGMTDKVPALLTPGEFVVRKRVAEQYGPLLESLNGQVFPKENFDKDSDEDARRKKDMDMMGATKEQSRSSLIDAVKNASRGELDKLLAISNQNSKDRVRLGVEPNRFNTGNLTGRLNDFRAMSNQKVFPTMKTNSFNSSSQTEKSGSMYNYNVNVTLNGSDMDANDVANAVIQKIKMTENKGIRSNNIRG